MKNAPKNKCTEVQRIVKEALTVILGKVEVLLRYELGLSNEGIVELNEIKHQVLRIDGLLEKIK
ncbi:hypothetical protein ES703_29958 [subsurface metagenome]